MDADTVAAKWRKPSHDRNVCVYSGKTERGQTPRGLIVATTMRSIHKLCYVLVEGGRQGWREGREWCHGVVSQGENREENGYTDEMRGCALIFQLFTPLALPPSRSLGCVLAAYSAPVVRRNQKRELKPDCRFYKNKLNYSSLVRRTSHLHSKLMARICITMSG